MNDPIRMVFVNLIASIILLLGVLIYRYVYPKKNINLFVLLLLVSILPILSVFRYGDYESGDLNIHVYRTMAFYNALKQGQILPSWAGDLNATYGYGEFIFLNPLPYFLQSFFHFIGFSFIQSLKNVIILSSISSGLFFYLWARKETKHELASFTGTIVYLFIPYHLINLHFRVDIGEILFFVFLPLFFYTFKNFSEKRNLLTLFTSSLAFSLLLFSHQAVSVFSMLIIIPYIIFTAYKTENFIKNIFIFLLPILIGSIYSIYSWIPHIIYRKYTFVDYLNNGILYQPISELLYSPWKYGFLFQGPNGQLNLLIGYTELFALLASIVILFWKKQIFARSSLIFWTIESIFLLFLITKYSSLIWNTIPVLGIAQFTYRLMLPFSFSVSTVVVFLVLIFKRKTFFVWIFILLTIGYTILNWGQRRVIPSITDMNLMQNLPYSSYEAEGLTFIASPKWIDIKNAWMKKIPQKHLDFLSGTGQITPITRKNVSHEYVVNAISNATLIEYTYYFPGWTLFVDGKQKPINPSNKKFPGIITFPLTKGLHLIQLQYRDISELLTAKIVSLTTIAFSLVFLLLIFLRKKSIDHSINVKNLQSAHRGKKRKR